MAGSRPKPRERCEAALTPTAHCDTSSVVLRHHTPEEAGEFSSNSGFGDIGLFAVLERHTVIFASQAFVGLVCVCDDCGRVGQQGSWI